MTNLEAADLLDNLIGMVSDNHDSDYDEALSKGRDILKSEPCEDCISRQAAIALITEYQKGFDAVMNIGGKVSMEELADDIKLLNSSVTPQPKTGHWIAIEDEEGNIVGHYCSKCDLPLETDDKTMYCPHCGCRMSEVWE